MTTQDDIAAREMVLERVVNAPRNTVWKAWTEPAHIAQWWGPNGFTTTIYEMTVTVGGVWRFIMHGPDGTDYPNRIRYTEIVKPERLVFDHGGADGGPREFQTTVIFVAEGERTRVTMRALFESQESCEAHRKFGAVEGGEQTLARLAEHVEGMIALTL